MILEMFIEPVGRSFDASALQHYLLAQPHSARDLFQPDTIVMALSDTVLDRALVERSADPSRFSRSLVLVTTRPERLEIAYWTSQVEPLREFVRWVRNSYEVRFRDETLQDITPQVDAKLNYLFGEP